MSQQVEKSYVFNVSYSEVMKFINALDAQIRELKDLLTSPDVIESGLAKDISNIIQTKSEQRKKFYDAIMKAYEKPINGSTMTLAQLERVLLENNMQIEVLQEAIAVKALKDSVITVDLQNLLESKIKNREDIKKNFDNQLDKIIIDVEYESPLVF